MSNRRIPLFDFSDFGKAIKDARMKQGESRKKASDEMNLSPRYLANIENNGQHPSLQLLYELTSRYHLSVDEFFFPEREIEKTAQRRMLDCLLEDMSDEGLRILTASAKEIVDIEKERKGR